MNILNYKEYGEEHRGKTPVIILHGLLGMLDNWHSFSKMLSSEFHVLSIDQRNHGKSFHSDAFSYELLSRDLHAFLEPKSITKCHLIGHSMGGKTVMQFALDFPTKVEKSIIVDIAPKEYSGGHEHIFKALLELDLTKIEKRSAAAELLNSKLNDMGVVQFLLKNLHRNSEGQYSWKANVSVLKDNYDAIKSSLSENSVIENPTLFVRGGQSKYILDSDFDLIHSIFPNNKIKTIEGAGHWVHAAKPKELLDIVNKYLTN